MCLQILLLLLLLLPCIHCTLGMNLHLSLFKRVQFLSYHCLQKMHIGMSNCSLHIINTNNSLKYSGTLVLVRKLNCIVKRIFVYRDYIGPR